ncbi:multidrug efflux system protein MdtL [Salmonella enterica subsp. enterica serovar Daytona]|uniref:Multidrug efflux system protein MdtL n=1 Tax=Salmonella enterica subsp. enterica serovar Daytona TaxID=1962639 RepID=A0A447JRE6_SALET|nr:multidrug efflux system protein MdtL [Salmonella enterica subsp. enterica serovar Daytona]
MEVMGFSRGDYAITMALTAGVSMVVSFSTPFALGLFKPRTLMLVSQGLFLTAGVTLSLAHTNTVTLFGLTLICAGFSVGFGVAMSQALGPFSLRAGSGQFPRSVSRRFAVHHCGFGWRQYSVSAR